MVTTGMVAGILACAGGSLILGAFLWWVNDTEGPMATVTVIGCLFLLVAFVLATTHATILPVVPR